VFFKKRSLVDTDALITYNIYKFYIQLVTNQESDKSHRIKFRPNYTLVQDILENTPPQMQGSLNVAIYRAINHLLNRRRKLKFAV